MEYSDISILQYLKTQKVIADKDLTDEQRMSEICKTLFNIDIENLPVREAVHLMNEATELLSSNFKSEDSPVVNKLNINGTKCTVTDVDSMTFAQFVDFQNFSKDANEHLVDILAVAIVPVGSKYNDGSYDLNEFKENLAKLPITTALSVVRFFQVRSLESLITSVTCSVETKGLSFKERIKVKWNLLKTLVALRMMKKSLSD